MVNGCAGAFFMELPDDLNCQKPKPDQMVSGFQWKKAWVIIWQFVCSTFSDSETSWVTQTVSCSVMENTLFKHVSLISIWSYVCVCAAVYFPSLNANCHTEKHTFTSWLNFIFHLDSDFWMLWLLTVTRGMQRRVMGSSETGAGSGSHHSRCVWTAPPSALRTGPSTEARPETSASANGEPRSCTSSAAGPCACLHRSWWQPSRTNHTWSLSSPGSAPAAALSLVGSGRSESLEIPPAPAEGRERPAWSHSTHCRSAPAAASCCWSDNRCQEQVSPMTDQSWDKVFP